jgi:hypothetical protein
MRSKLDTKGKLPDSRLLVLHCDNPEHWRTACEVVLLAGLRHAQEGAKMWTEEQIRQDMGQQVHGRNGHWSNLRHIYGAAYDGIAFIKGLVKLS